MTTIDPGPGPKPAGPTHPTPTGPPPAPRSGHLPISAPVVGIDRVTGVPVCEHGDDADACQLRHTPIDSGPRVGADRGHARDAAPVSQSAGVGPTTPVGADCDCGHGDLDQMFHLTPCPRARPLRPMTLANLVADLRLLTAKAMAMTSRQWDPSTGPQQQDVPLGPDWVDIQLAEVRVDLRSALTALDGLRRDLGLDHPVRFAPGYRPTPGLAITGAPVAVSRGSDDGPPYVVAGASPLVGPGDRPTPGSAAAVAPAARESTHAVVAPSAGASSGSRSGAPQVGAGAGLAQGVAPMGASFSLPQPPRWSW